MQPIIVLDAIHKSFGAFAALNGVSGEVKAGEVVVVCGPSGSGKSTLIRCVNALEVVDQGRVLVEGVDIHAKGADINLLRQRMGFVFQQFNLFPHLTAVDNVSLGLRKLGRVRNDEARRRAIVLLDRVGLAHRADQFPASLSGGEQQRVAIARALAMEPPILLLDEPTSALDPEVVGEVLAIVRALSKSGITMIFVTHEMGFARAAADWIWFMEAGAVVERASPEAFFGSPSHPSTRRFISSMSARHSPRTR